MTGISSAGIALFFIGWIVVAFVGTGIYLVYILSSAARQQREGKEEQAEIDRQVQGDDQWRKFHAQHSTIRKAQKIWDQQNKHKGTGK